MDVLVLRDRKPGHFRQAEAIGSLAAGSGGTVRSLDVRPRPPFHDAVRRLLLAAGTPPAALLRLVYGIAPGSLGRPDVIVASGRPTVLAAIAAARLTGARLVYRGAAIGYPPSAFDLVLVAEPGQADGAVRVFAPVPTPVDPEALPVPRPLRAAADFAGARAGLLVGGNSHSHRWSDGEWSALRGLVAATAEDPGLSWTVVSSRRTPDAAADAFAALAAGDRRIDFVDWRRAGTGSIDAALGADLLLVTSDSTSMVADACGAMRPVIAIDPADMRETAADRALAVFAARGQLARLPAAGLSPAAVVGTAVRLSPPAVSPRRELAAVLAARLPAAGRTPVVRVITDGKAGDEQPLVGIAEAMGVGPDVRRVAPGLPFALAMPHGPVPPRDRPDRPGSPIGPPFPDVCLVTGRRAIAYGRALKAASPRTLLVVVKDPRTARHGADLVVAQAHDRMEGPGVMTVVTGPHRMSAGRLAAARAAPPPALAALPAPRVAVLVGGDSRHYRFTDADADRLLDGLRRLLDQGASLMVTASRRTPPGLAARLARLGAAPGAFVWDGTGDNPLAAMLALADAVVVTADSTNMIGEAAATGRPIQVFHPSGGHDKTTRFLEALGRVATVAPFPAAPDLPGYAPVDSTPAIADRIGEMLAARGLTRSAAPARS